MTKLKGWRNTKAEWDKAYGHLDGKPETWMNFNGMTYFHVIYETDEDVVRELLPPPIEYAGGDEPPQALIWYFSGPGQGVGIDGATGGRSMRLKPHVEVGLFVGPATCNGVTGLYCPAMWVEGDVHMVSGREFHGAPKKIIQGNFERYKNKIACGGTRYNIDFFKIKASLTGKSGESMPEALPPVLTLKHMPSANGGFDVAKIIAMDAGFKDHERNYEVDINSIEIIFEESPWDPMHEIPVRKIVAASYTEDLDIKFHGKEIAQADPDVIKEYVLYRYS